MNFLGRLIYGSFEPISTSDVSCPDDTENCTTQRISAYTGKMTAYTGKITAYTGKSTDFASLGPLWPPERGRTQNGERAYTKDERLVGRVYGTKTLHFVHFFNVMSRG